MPEPFKRAGHEPGPPDLDDEIVEILTAHLSRECRDGDHGMIFIRWPVAAHLHLVFHHTDHGVGQGVDRDPLPDRLNLPEDLPRQVVTEKNDPALLRFVERVEESAARLSKMVPDLPKLPV